MGKVFSKCVCSDESRPPTPNPNIDEMIAKLQREDEAAEVQTFAPATLFQAKPGHQRNSSASLSGPAANAEMRRAANTVLDAIICESSTEQASGPETSDSDSDVVQAQFNQGGY